ncbi:uncharacterized protein V6R79_010541 [Siganus canaliculatus]
MKTVTMLVLVLLLTCPSVSTSRPKCHSCQQTSCDCSRLNLTQVPLTPFQSVTELDLSSNAIRTIWENDFVTYATLRFLTMNNNVIQGIEERAFAPLTCLEKLDLSFNRLRSLSAEWFEHLVSLQHLDLLGNEYQTLGEGSLFQQLKSLKTLHFGGLRFQSLRQSDFSGLRTLDEVVFEGRNLVSYEAGSLRQIGPMKSAALSLNGPFAKKPPLAGAILSDVIHPNTTLTITHTFFMIAPQMFPFKAVHDGRTKTLAFKKVNITVSACVKLVQILVNSNLRKFQMEDTKFLLDPWLGQFPVLPTMDHLEEVFFRNVDVPQFYNFPALFFLKPLFNVVRRVTLINCKVFALPCESSEDFSNLEYVDMSNNIMTDLTFSEMFCQGEGILWNLQTLNVSGNDLHFINSQLVTKLDNLQNIDMSRNVFRSMPDTCFWPPRLRFLNLSSTHLRGVTACLPPTLHVLDVSDNSLTVFNIELPLLRELYIYSNQLRTLPPGASYPQLSFLSIQNNDLHGFSSSNLKDYRSLTRLHGGTDTFICSCEFVAFMTNELTHNRVALGDDFKSYICESPDAARGRSVLDADLSVFECHTVLALSLVVGGILALVLLVAGLCHKFNVLWYMRMTWAWLRAKKKPKLKKGELEFDAFVSYSEMDSGWVDAHLVPELEQVEPRLRLCLHKRDFIPGGWILDNIMDAIEKSHRTLFVLSQHFVNSEWCKYELDYTHFRLFDHNDDTVVLILLEPIDKDTIPKKFCKLRKVMNSRTYLEWPDDDNHVARFWQSLRSAIKRAENADDNTVDETQNL